MIIITHYHACHLPVQTAWKTCLEPSFLEVGICPGQTPTNVTFSGYIYSWDVISLFELIGSPQSIFATLSHYLALPKLSAVIMVHPQESGAFTDV